MASDYETRLTGHYQKDFNDLIDKVCKSLTKDELEEMKRRFKGIINVDVHTWEEFFSILSMKKHVTPSNIVIIQVINRLFKRKSTDEKIQAYLSRHRGPVLHFVEIDNGFIRVFGGSTLSEDKKKDLLTILSKLLMLPSPEYISFSCSDTYSEHDMENFDKALRVGFENDNCVRIMVCGNVQQGKTSLTRRLLSQSLEGIESTSGFDVHKGECKIKNGMWTVLETQSIDLDDAYRLLNVNFSSDYVDSPQNPHQVDKMNNKTFQLYEHYSKNSKQGRNKASRQDRSISVNIWDFGGQFIYYATHQIFHSKDSIYLLVFDLTKELDSVEIDIYDSSRKYVMQDSLLFWVNSVHRFVGSDVNGNPKIVLVGTHKASLKDANDINTAFEKLRSLFAGSEAGKHIHERPFAVENLDPNDETVQELQREIYSLHSKMSKGNPVPAKWILLERELQRQKEKKIITSEELNKINDTLLHPIQDSDNLKSFLEYHNDRGNLIYFDEDGLRGHVVLDPQYLIDAFKCLIESKQYCKYRNYKLDRQREQFEKTAILTSELIDGIWGESEAFRGHKSVLLRFFEKHRILSKLKSTSDEKYPNRLIVPSMLKSVPNEVFNRTLDKIFENKECTIVTLGIELESKCLLISVFEEITAGVLSNWTAVDFEGQYMVSKDHCLCKFDDDKHVGLIVLNGEDGIELTVSNQCPPFGIDPVLCDNFRRYIINVIGAIIKTYTDETGIKHIDYYIKCRHPLHGSIGSKMFKKLKDIKETKYIACPDFGNHDGINLKKAIAEWILKISEEDIKRVPRCTLSDKDLSIVSRALGENSKGLAESLKLTVVEGEQISTDYRSDGIRKTNYEMLRKWRDKNPGINTLQDLIEVLKCENKFCYSVDWEIIWKFVEHSKM